MMLNLYKVCHTATKKSAHNISLAAPIQLQKQCGVILLALVPILQPPVLRGLLVCQHAHEIAVVVHKDCVCTVQCGGCVAAGPESLTRKPSATQESQQLASTSNL